MTRRLFLGLISGTSMDGVDAALAAIDDSGLELIHADCVPYPDALRAELGKAIDAPESLNVIDLGRLDARIGDFFGRIARKVIEDAGCATDEVTAIGSHGQTVYHDTGIDPPVSRQIGDPNRIAEATGRPVVADFRRRDTAAGGQGAPLASALHADLFSDPRESRAVLNLGGIANLTLLPAGARHDVQGFDTGPASCLMDEWIRLHHGQAFDDEGQWAAGGRVDSALLDELLADPYFAAAPPKSTGREYFNLSWLRAHPRVAEVEPRDVQATLLALTAESVVRALRETLPGCHRLLLCGGGVRNATLWGALKDRLTGIRLASTEEHGLPPDWVEAALFAWLAHRRIAGLPGNLPGVTGASGPRVLGAIYE